jgi:hypothetical protein
MLSTELSLGAPCLHRSRLEKTSHFTVAAIKAFPSLSLLEGEKQDATSTFPSTD